MFAILDNLTSRINVLLDTTKSSIRFIFFENAFLLVLRFPHCVTFCVLVLWANYTFFVSSPPLTTADHYTFTLPTANN